MPGPIAYLVGYYPAVSHTFITREVDGLRARGLDVQTFSLRDPPAATLLTDADRREAAATFVIQRAGVRRIAGAQFRALRAAPWRFLRSLAWALGRSPGGARNGLWQLFYLAEATVLREELARRGIGHVHVHFANAASAVAMLAARLGGGDGPSWSFTMHGPTELDDVTRYDLAEKVRRARFVACIGDFCRSQLMKLVTREHWDRLAVIRLGVDPARFVPTDRRGRSGPVEVLCTGRLVPDKGQAVLIEAVARLRAQSAEVRLTLAGDGPDRPGLEALARCRGLGDSVTFAGAVDQERLRGLYAAADVFCLASFAEGIPVVLMEAMACALPVVATPVAGIPELIADGRTGRLVAPGRVGAFAAALSELCADAEMRQALGAAGRREVEQRWDLERSVAELHACFASL